MKKLFFFWALICSSVLSFSSLSAHLDAGADRIVNGYLVDFGYTPEEPRAGTPGQIAFNLINPETEAPVPFDHLWVRISDADRVIFAGTFFPEVEHVVFTNTFPSAGLYEVTSRFKARDKTLVETSFPLNVLPAEEASVPTQNNWWQRIRRFFAELW